MDTLKRILIPRKNKSPRPIGLSDFTDKVLQRALKLVLDYIYEPIFESTNENYGFKSNKSTYKCITEVANHKNQ